MSEIVPWPKGDPLDIPGASAPPRCADGRPRALDLFAGVGGATRGLQRAGFHVVGVDSRPQRRYCGDAFVQADALAPPFDLARFDLIWASPPCQDSSILRQLPWLKDREYPQLIPQTRAMLRASGRPFVIENVLGAPLRRDLVLCGTQFGLSCYRHRAFEIEGFFCLSPSHAKHRERIGGHLHLGASRPKGHTLNASLARGSWGKGGFVTVAGHQFKRCDGEAALGIDWASSRAQLAQAIPPAYAEFIGRAALQYLRRPA
jgi:hypothetical protein